MVTRRLVLVALVLAILAPSSAIAVITFTQLDSDTFTVSHRIKGFGSRGKAMDLVYEKAASLCIAAGFTHMEILGQESVAAGGGQQANASVRVQFFFEDGEDRVLCEVSASPTYTEDARKKLKKKGYVPPEKPAAEASEEEFGSRCTVEQITAMVRAGLKDDQIRAACGDPED